MSYFRARRLQIIYNRCLSSHIVAHIILQSWYPRIRVIGNLFSHLSFDRARGDNFFWSSGLGILGLFATTYISRDTFHEAPFPIRSSGIFEVQILL